MKVRHLPRHAGKDTRPPRGMWCPGEYAGHCVKCHQLYWGHKESSMCAPCAYGNHSGDHNGDHSSEQKAQETRT